jgi:hypothetical protein
MGTFSEEDAKAIWTACHDASPDACMQGLALLSRRACKMD